MNKEDIIHLNQIFSTLEESISKLEIAYEKNNSEDFDKTKKFILNLLEKINETAK